MSLSRGAWVVVMAMCLAIPILKFLRESDGNFSLRFIFLAVVVGTFVTAYLLPNLEWLLLLLGRDLSLTGRTDIWELAVEAGWDRPILGAGYRSFWTLLSNTLRWGHGHNSFLDLWLELGFVGLGLFLVVIAIAIRRAVYHMKSEPGRLGLWPMIFLVYMLLSGTVTNTFPNHGTITWTLLVATCLYLSSAAAERARSVSPRRVPLGSLT
jgi:O-antigen ligase